MPKVFIVEDDESIRSLIKMTLTIENYQIEEADDGEKAYEMIQNNKYDLILLDIMLPKMDGYQLLQKIKEKNIPVIFLSAKISLQDKVFGLKLGADDYITKPFEPIELLARIEAVIRRNQRNKIIEPEEVNNKIITYRDIEVNLEERTVKKNGIEVALTMKEFELLQIFIENLNIVLSREQLLEKIWGYDYYGETRTVDMHIKQLRQKLELKEHLETVFKIGYKLKG